MIIVIMGKEVFKLIWFFDYGFSSVVSQFWLVYFVPLIIGFILSLAEFIYHKQTEYSSRSNRTKPQYRIIIVFTLIFFMLVCIAESAWYSSVKINLPALGECIYFGNTKNGYAHGKGRLFDNKGSPIYAGRFTGSLYDGKGKLYAMDEQGKPYIKYEGDFVEGKLSGTAREYNSTEKLVYDGEYMAGFRCGKGIYFGDGFTYTGGFAFDQMNGYGVWSQPDDNIILEGMFINNELEPSGTIISIDSGLLSYEGNFQNSYKSGFGITFYEDRTIKHEGEYSNGQYHGIGKEYSPMGTLTYEGNFTNGAYDGFDCKMYDEETGRLIYLGRMENGYRSGQGTSYFIDNEEPIVEYEGIWKNNEWHGQGTEYYPSGKIQYEGQFQEGLFDGYGTLTRSDSTTHEGYFHNGSPSGWGKREYSDNYFYDGDWRDGNRCGYGKLSYGDVEVYDGYWNNDQREGYGIQYFTDSADYYEGIFKNDKYDGYGTCYYEEGDKYVGEWVHGKADGHGTHYHADGTISSGIWKNHKLVRPDQVPE